MLASTHLDTATIDLIGRLLDDARAGRISRADVCPAAGNAAPPGAAQALLFLKPEALTSDGDLPAVLQLLRDHLHEHDVELGGLAVVGWRDLAGGVMAAHYSVINQVSTRGVDALTSAARAELERLFPEALDSDSQILGAHQVLERHALTSDELLNRAETAGITKAGQGTYAALVDIDGSQHVVLNAFHPAQLEHFTAAGAAIVLLEAHFRDAWSCFRDDFLGATNPQKANTGSLRARFIDLQGPLGLAEVSSNRNCVHGSAGPVEGMTELSRFFRLGLPETALGARLLKAGLDAGSLEWACANPTLTDGASLFEVTECVCPDEAVEMLLRLRG